MAENRQARVPHPPSCLLRANGQTARDEDRGLHDGFAIMRSISIRGALVFSRRQASTKGDNGDHPPNPALYSGGEGLECRRAELFRPSRAIRRDL